MISGEKRENNFEERVKKVGLFQGKVVVVNPTREEFKEKLGIDLKEDSTATDYLGQNDEGDTKLRIDVWFENVKDSNFKGKLTYFLENTEAFTKDGSKQWYINNLGSTSCVSDEKNLKDWFTKREYRKAFKGEKDLYEGFLRPWLSKLNYQDKDAVLQVDWKKLMKGNIKEISDQIGGEFSGDLVIMAEIRTQEKDGETKEYQNFYNKTLPGTYIKNFRLVDYSKQEVQDSLKGKAPKDLKSHEKFVLDITGDYGSKNFFLLKELTDYDPKMNLVSSNEPISSDGSDY